MIVTRIDNFGHILMRCGITNTGLTPETGGYKSLIVGGHYTPNKPRYIIRK